MWSNGPLAQVVVPPLSLLVSLLSFHALSTSQAVTHEAGGAWTMVYPSMGVGAPEPSAGSGGGFVMVPLSPLLSCLIPLSLSCPSLLHLMLDMPILTLPQYDPTS